MKKICFIRQTAIYDDSRATKTIHSLVEKGYEVLVLGWDRDGKAAQQTQKIFDPQKVHCEFYDQRLQHGSGMKGLWKLLGFLRWVRKTVKKNRRQIDAIHACDLDGALGAYGVAKKKKIPFVYDIYDYYIEAHVVPNPLRNVVEKMELNIINHADCVIICSEPRIKQIDKSSPKKVVVIHNSPALQVEASTPRERGEGDRIRMAFIGTLSRGRLLGEILDQIGQNQDIELQLGGLGEFVPAIEQAAQTFDNVKYYGALPYKRVLELEKEADVLFAVYDPSIPNHKFSAPNKIYEAMALGKPIVVCKGTCIDELVEAEDIGRAIEYRAEDLFACVREMMQNKPWMQAVADRGQRLYQEKYSWDIMSDRLGNIYEELVSKK